MMLLRPPTETERHQLQRPAKWQRRGTGCYWTTYEKPGWDPKRQQPVTATRRRLHVDEELPCKDGYADFIRRLIAPYCG
ncbi:MAG TPA: hypothetical protein VGO93_06390 [Candidatus Xenobia bacterium]